MGAATASASSRGSSTSDPANTTPPRRGSAPYPARTGDPPAPSASRNASCAPSCWKSRRPSRRSWPIEPENKLEKQSPTQKKKKKNPPPKKKKKKKKKKS